MLQPLILPVILAGGSGERLWPLSRSTHPKQFLALLGAKHSLFQNTLQRVVNIANKLQDSDRGSHAMRSPGMAQLCHFLAPLIVCNEEHRFIVAEQLRQLQTKVSGIILETKSNNTAPAIALAAHWAQMHAPNCTMLVLPADHLIQDVDEMQQVTLTAAYAAQNDLLITFGIKITKPEIGYGYIKLGAPLAQQMAGHYVAEFIEKPDLLTATSMFNNQDYVWNSGMFLFKPELYLKELALYQPTIATATAQAMQNCTQDADFVRPNKQNYIDCPAISIDYALMEHTQNAAVFKLNSAWSDIGNWHAVWEQSTKDSAGNAIDGDVIALQTQNCLITARHKLIATLDVQDLIIVETADAVLVSKKDQSQQLKQILTELKALEHNAVHEHRQVIRPWGWYDVITKNTTFLVKIIYVQPGKSLSLQVHKYRSEHWVVVKGTAQVIRGDDTFMLHANESTFIPSGVKHRLSNSTNEVLEIIEVQSGSYLGEDDIIRFADEHGRATVDSEEHVNQ